MLASYISKKYFENHGCDIIDRKQHVGGRKHTQVIDGTEYYFPNFDGFPIPEEYR